MKYSECPTVAESVNISSSVSEVWKLISDIALPARFSSEIRSVEWNDGHHGPALGASFQGHSVHDAIGEWSTTCFVSQFEKDRIFEWSVSGTGSEASSMWRYTIEATSANSVTLEHWFQMGPARSGLSHAIESMPDKEDRIIARRLQEHSVNMRRMLKGIKDLAEDQQMTS